MLAALMLLQVASLAKPSPDVTAGAQATIYGTWEGKDRTILDVYPCGVVNGQPADPHTACVRILQPSARRGPDAPDTKDPDPAKRQLPLRFKIIGSDFRVANPVDAESATGGKLYDADNGRTYPSSLALKGDQLKLHSTRFFFFGHTVTCRRVELQKPSPYVLKQKRKKR